LTGSIEGISVANIKSQKKRNLQNMKRAERNKGSAGPSSRPASRPVRSWSAVRMSTQREAGSAATRQGRLKGIIHKNQAARRKSRLMKKLAAEQS
jgi:small subunit ribosomal protein S20